MSDTKVEQYLIDAEISYEEVEKNIWFLDDADHGFEGIVIMLNEPLLVFRLPVMEVPEKNKLELFTKPLELNSADLLHGAYALEGKKIVLVDTLEYDGMDANEFKATLDSFSMAVIQHYPLLSQYRS